MSPLNTDMLMTQHNVAPAGSVEHAKHTDMNSEGQMFAGHEEEVRQIFDTIP